MTLLSYATSDDNDNELIIGMKKYVIVFQVSMNLFHMQALMIEESMQAFDKIGQIHTKH